MIHRPHWIHGIHWSRPRTMGHFSHRVHLMRLRLLIKRTTFARLIFWDFPLKARLFVPFFRDFLADIFLFGGGTIAQVRKNSLSGSTTFCAQFLPICAFLRTKIGHFSRNFHILGGGRDRRLRTRRRRSSVAKRCSHHNCRYESSLFHTHSLAKSVPTVLLGLCQQFLASQYPKYI